MNDYSRSLQPLHQALQCRLKSLVPENFSGKFIIAYSGGIDSHVLLHALTCIDLPANTLLHAVYIHHGLQTEATPWQEHCRCICQTLGLSFSAIAINIKQEAGLSLEAEARHSRYAALAQCMKQGDVLLTAQHEDDQAETLLLQLIRGAGVEGLAAMPEITRFHQGWHMRPMLNLSREQIHTYARAHALSWKEDPSNQDTAYARNYLRHEIMPLLQRRWPSVNKTLSRSAQHCASHAALQNTLMMPLFTQAYDASTASLSLKRLYESSSLERMACLRLFIKTAGFEYPSTKKMHSLQQQMFSSRSDAMPCVTWGNVELRRYQQRLYLMPKLLPFDSSQRMRFDLDALQHKPLKFEFLGGVCIEVHLTQSETNETGIPLTLLQGEPLSIRFRQGGERLFIPAQKRHHSLKNFFQEKGIAPWLRPRVPLLYVGEVLMFVTEIKNVHANGSIAGISTRWMPPLRPNEFLVKIVDDENCH